jgi:hypothetical protein
MANIVGSFKIVVSKKEKFGSGLFTKFAYAQFNGRSASIFRISTDYSMNP